MLFEINNTDHGYVVEAYWPDKDGNRHWEPLRNFGDRQGDARDFMNVDCPELSDANIKALINRYDPSVRYIRVEKHKFYKVKS